MMLDGLEIADRTHVVALGDHDRGREDPARAVGRLHRERDAGLDAARRPRRPRPGSRPGDPVRDRRRQGAAQGDQGRVRRARAGASLSPPQGAKCQRSAARARPAADPRPDPRRVGADRPSPRPRAARAARLRARPHLARRRRVAARGDGRHADADAARDRRAARQDAVARRTRARA